MNVFILGSGGRESSLYDVLLKSPHIKNLYTVPGNAGTNTPSDLQNIEILDFDNILQKVLQYNIHAIFVGPEVPLALGIKDFFAKNSPDTIIIGPNQYQAQIESSKIFSFQFMQKFGIPQANGYYTNSYKESLEILKKMNNQYVIKVDGLSAGKGVSIHDNKNDGKERLKEILHKKQFDKEEEKVLIQEFMHGQEASLFALCNGKEAIYLPTAQDYKPIYENNLGPNTGGMGSYSPTTSITELQLNFIHNKIVTTILNQLQYKGLLYLGLMLHSKKEHDLSIVEFNCRFGDPETQAILPILAEDLFPYLLWTESKEKEILIPKYKIHDYYVIPYNNQTCINVVLSSRGYPKQYLKKLPIKLPSKIPDSYYIYPAGLSKNNNQYFSTGGRIMNIGYKGTNLSQCRKNIYSYIENTILSLQSQEVQKNLYYRKDIGK